MADDPEPDVPMLDEESADALETMQALYDFHPNINEDTNMDAVAVSTVPSAQPNINEDTDIPNIDDIPDMDEDTDRTQSPCAFPVQETPNTAAVVPSVIQNAPAIVPGASAAQGTPTVPGPAQETLAVVPVAKISRPRDVQESSSKRRTLERPAPAAGSERAVNFALDQKVAAQMEAKEQRKKLHQKEQELQRKNEELEKLRIEMTLHQQQMKEQWQQVEDERQQMKNEWKTLIDDSNEEWHQSVADRERELEAEAEKRKAELEAEAEKRKQELEAETEKRKQELEAEAEKRKQEQEAEAEKRKKELEEGAVKNKADLEARMAAFAARQTIYGPPRPNIDRNFPIQPPELVPKVVSDGVRKQRNLQATRTPASSGSTSATSQTNPSQSLPIDWNDPRLEEKLAPIVQKLFQQHGIKDMTVTRTVRRKKENKYTTAKKNTTEQLTKEQIERWQALAREFLVVTTGCNQAKDYRDYEPATDDQKEQCDEGNLIPEANSKLYFGSALQERQNADHHHWGVPKVQGNYIVSLFRTTITGYQAEWKRAQPLPGETLGDACARLTTWDERRLDQVSWKKRKATKYKSREAIIEKMIHIEIEIERKQAFLGISGSNFLGTSGSNNGDGDNTQPTNLVAWRFLQQLLGHLQKDGMSSEEVSEHEMVVGVERALVQVHKVLVSPWRNEKIRKYMEWVDEAGANLKLKSTAHRTRRRLAGGEKIFDDDIEATLEISSEEFKVLEIASMTFHKAKGKGRASDPEVESSGNACTTHRPQEPRPNALLHSLMQSGRVMATSSATFSRAEPSCPTVPPTSVLTGHFRAGEQIFSVYKGWRSIVLSTPTPKEAQCMTPQDFNPDFRRPTYITPRMPYHVFIPQYNPWHGPLLSILDYTFDNLPIVHFPQDNMWSLDRGIVDSWKSFEDCLCSVGRELPSLTSKPFPQEIEPWHIPGRYHYGLYYRSEKSARSAVWRCRKRFLPLLGCASMGLWFMAHEEDEEVDIALGTTSGSKRKAEPQGKRTPWRQALAEKLQILPSWIDALEMSVANDWRTPRVGALVDLRSSEVLSFSEHTGLEWLIYSILRSNCPIPLYFIWGDVPRSISITYAVPRYIQLLNFMPDSRQIDYMVSLPGHVAFSPLTCNENGFQPVHYKQSLYPRPPQQKPTFTPRMPAPAKVNLFTPHDGENIHLDLPPTTRISFSPFLPLSPAAVKNAASETPQDKTTRMQRADNAKRGQAPGKKGARVYVWTKEETDNGFYIRRPGGRNKYDSLFEDYPPSQRRYDSFNDEWDLCSAFGDGEDGSDDQDVDFGDDDDDYGGYLEANFDKPAVDYEHDPLPLINVRPASEQDLERIYLNFGPHPDEKAEVMYQPIAGDFNTALYK
ncbi:hypothetical protein K438DRAFT_1993382 [Mycena galopus ATCC 62051]|nr:hypothetical protein K438DRAFT_1993382 [Mycena galopus ATCC 62051]